MKVLLIVTSLAWGISLVLGQACSRAHPRAPELGSYSDAVSGGDVDTSEQTTTGGPVNEQGPLGASLVCSNLSTAYSGFGGRKLTLTTVDAEEAPVYRDRFRLKTYDVFGDELKRVTGIVPAGLLPAKATFSAAPARWYVEPQHSSITLFTFYGIAYEATLKMAQADTNFSKAPDLEGATATCESFATKAWNMKPLKVQVDACVKVALEDTVSLTTPEMRWAHALASVLTASNFLSY